MSKYLVLKQLSSLIEKYTPKLGTLIQTLPADDIFENPRTLTTQLYNINGVNVPIVKPTPPQQPPLSLKTLNDLKRYLKDSKSKEILSEYIKQQEAYESQQKLQEPLLAIERAKQTKKEVEKEDLKAIEGKALEDMTEAELVEFNKRDDISVSDKKKALNLIIKLRQKPKKMLAIEASPKEKVKEKVKEKEKEKEAPKKEEAEVVREVDPNNLTDEQALKQLEPPIVEDEAKAKIRERIVEIYKFKDILNGKKKGTLPFKTEDELIEYVASFKKAKKEWSNLGGNTSTITTPLNQLMRLYGIKKREEKKRQEELQAEEERQIKLQKEKEAEEAKKKAEKKPKKKAKAAAEAKPE